MRYIIAIIVAALFTRQLTCAILSNQMDTSLKMRNSTVLPKCDKDIISNLTGLQGEAHGPMVPSDYQKSFCNDEMEQTCCTDQEFVKLNLILKIQKKKLKMVYLMITLIGNYLNSVSTQDFEHILDQTDNDFLKENGLTREALIQMKTDFQKNFESMKKNLLQFTQAQTVFQHANICLFCDFRNLQFTMQTTFEYNFKDLVYYDSSQCKYFFETIKDSKYFEYFAKQSDLLDLVKIIGRVVDGINPEINITNRKLRINKNRQQIDECLDNSADSDLAPECVTVCSQNLHILQNPHRYYVMEIEYALSIMQIFQEQLNQRERLDQTINKGTLQEMSKIRTQDGRSNLPTFRCFFERVVLKGFDFCNSNVILEDHSGINVEKYISVDNKELISSNQLKKSIDNSVDLAKFLCFVIMLNMLLFIF